MNKMHTLAKIMLSGMGIFFAIRLISYIPTPISLALTRPSETPILTATFSIVFQAICLAVLLYIFLYKGEQFAEKIVGTSEVSEPVSQIQWLPVAFRLISMAAGLYSLIILLWQMTYTLMSYAMLKARSVAGYKTIYTPPFLSVEKVLPWLIMLTIGIYLVCGAPHFVRWQVKKTLELCKQLPETK